MRIKKNDQIVVTAGKERGKKGRVLRVMGAKHTILVEKINYRTVYLRRSQQNPNGGISQVEGELPISNVKLLCPRCSKPTRVGYSILADRTKQRVCKRCQEII